MHTAAKKLHSQRGASMLFALLVFLLCLLAGVAALTAAAANAGRYTHVESEQQQYYSVASALELLQAQMDAAADPATPSALTVKVIYTETQKWHYIYQGTSPTTGEPIYDVEPSGAPEYTLSLDPAITPPLNYFQELLLVKCVPAEWWSATTIDASLTPKPAPGATSEATYVIRPAQDGGATPPWAESLCPVEVKVTAKDDYTLEMTLTAQNGSAYKLSAVWSGVAETDVDTETTTEGEFFTTPPTAGTGYDSEGIRKTTTTLTCTLRLSAENREVTFG